jgi:hypothetical protein
MGRLPEGGVGTERGVCVRAFQHDGGNLPPSGGEATSLVRGRDNDGQARVDGRHRIPEVTCLELADAHVQSARDRMAI